MTAQTATAELPGPRRRRLPVASQQRGLGEYPALMPLVVELHARGEGPFAGSDRRIKSRYLAKG